MCLCETYYGLKYDDIPVECHGGLTYSKSYVNGLFTDSGWWIGWDYAHDGDYFGDMHDDTSCLKKWTTAEIIEEVKKVISQLKQ
ncbi:MAG: hypothetical protein NC244_13615 [Alistipes senegalensis]|nr:hypothetical protein [Alistipes senegalensis]